MRLIVVGIALAIAASAGIVAMCVHLETPTSRYESYAAALSAGAMAEGKFIPRFLPQSSRNIVETHDIDSNALEITFDYSPGDMGGMDAACKRQGVEAVFQCEGWGTVRLQPNGKGRLIGPAS